MNLTKSAYRLNFLAAALFLVNTGVSIYLGQSDYWKYLGLALFFAVLGYFYLKKYKKKEDAN